MISKTDAFRPVDHPTMPLRTIHTLYNRQQMALAMHRERARCDRLGQTMTLVSFRPATPPTPRQVARLGRMLSARVRLTDEIGWMDERRLGVMLPGTDEHGARHLARDVCTIAQRHGMELAVGVWRYPAEARSPRVQAQNGAPQRPIDRADLMPFVAEGLLEELLAEKVEPAPLESLLARPLPAWKRALDLVGASVGLLLTAPLLLIAAVLIKLTSPGKVIFKQQRTGLGGRPFAIYKLRTMVNGAEKRQAALRGINEQDGPAFKLTNDPRVTTIGRFLRTTSLDELPQLWNVLKGDMSLVGPRPLPVAEASACEQWHRRRHDVTPGLTCVWQVQGRSSVSFAQWMRMDVGYIRARTLLQDIKLIVLTVPSVLLRKGAR